MTAAKMQARYISLHVCSYNLVICLLIIGIPRYFSNSCQPQLDREIFLPTPTEQYQTIVTRFKDIAVPGITLVGTFEKQGWLRGGAGDGGGCTKHAKHFQRANLIAHIEYSGGIAMWDVRDSTEIQITRCYFTPLNYDSGSMLGRSYQRALPLGEVNKIVCARSHT